MRLPRHAVSCFHMGLIAQILPWCRQRHRIVNRSPFACTPTAILRPLYIPVPRTLTRYRSLSTGMQSAVVVRATSVRLPSARAPRMPGNRVANPLHFASKYSSFGRGNESKRSAKLVGEGQGTHALSDTLSPPSKQYSPEIHNDACSVDVVQHTRILNRSSCPQSRQHADQNTGYRCWTHSLHSRHQRASQPPQQACS